MTDESSSSLPRACPASTVAERLAGMGVSVARPPTAPRPPRTATARCIVVVSPKGGSGKTALASNLAGGAGEAHPRAGGRRRPRRAVRGPGHRPGPAARAHHGPPGPSAQIDATTVKVFLTPYDPGLFVLCGALTPEEADAVTPDHVSRVIPLLAQDFAYVVVDTPAGLDDRTLAAVECATDLLLVSSLDVTSIRSCARRSTRWTPSGSPRRGTSCSTGPTPRSDCVRGRRRGGRAAHRGHDRSAREIPLSMNVGTPVVKSEPRSAVAKQMSTAGSPLRTDRQSTSRSVGVGRATMSLSERIERAQSGNATVTSRPQARRRSTGWPTSRSGSPTSCSSASVSGSSRRRTPTACGPSVVARSGAIMDAEQAPLTHGGTPAARPGHRP